MSLGTGESIVNDRRVQMHANAGGNLRATARLEPARSGNRVQHRSSAARDKSQSERLLTAARRLALRDEDLAASVSEIAAGAGVSKATFYQCFTDREDCLLAMRVPLYSQLLGELRAAVRGAPPEQAVEVLTGRLVAFANDDRKVARLLLRDSLAGGARILDAHEEFLNDVGGILDHAFARLEPSAPASDLPPRLLTGVICRLLASALAHGEPISRGMQDELIAWTRAYEREAAAHRWRALTPSTPPGLSPYLAPISLRSPELLAVSPARRGQPAKEDQWLRIVFAAADVIARDGYEAAKVSDIARAAGVDRSSFYSQFDSKCAALAGGSDLLFGHLMAAVAGAFVAGERWSERVWEAARALTQSLEQNRKLAYVSLVESPAGGAQASRRLDELVGAFAIFLRQPPAHRDPDLVGRGELVRHAIVTGVFEISFMHMRRSFSATATHGLPALLGHVAFVCLAPFLGPAAAEELIAHKTASGGFATG